MMTQLDQCSPDQLTSRRGLTRGARIVVILAWIWFAAMLPFVTNSSLDLCASFPLVLIGFMLYLSWMTLTVVRSSLSSRPAAKWWYSVPAVGFLALSLTMTHWGLTLRVMLCESELQAAVDKVKDQNAYDYSHHRVGLFQVRSTDVRDGAVFLQTASEFIDSTGIAYVPPGTVVRGDYRLTHLYGNWYRFYWRF